MDLSIHELERIPGNFDEYIEEEASGIRDLYGAPAESQYRESAVSNLEISIRHLSVHLFAARIGGETVGYISCIHRSEAALIVHMHVLEKHLKRGVEGALAGYCVDHARQSGKRHIVSECVSSAPLRVGETFADMGFESVDRLIMGKGLRGSNMGDGASSHKIETFEDQAIAGILVQAYEHHPGRRLHLEVSDEAHAAEFLSSVRRGGYGKTRPEFIRAVDRAGVPVGMGLGCLVAPDVGFVLQVAVVPSHQGEGLGTALIADLEDEFRRAGLKKVALGVTWDNPARHLYERLGFEPWRPVTAYVWHDE